MHACYVIIADIAVPHSVTLDRLRKLMRYESAEVVFVFRLLNR